MIQKLNLEEKGWAMNKGLALLECVSFRARDMICAALCIRVAKRKKKNR